MISSILPKLNDKLHERINFIVGNFSTKYYLEFMLLVTASYYYLVTTYFVFWDNTTLMNYENG